MRRIILYAFVLLHCLAPAAWAGSIALVLSENSGPYAEFADSLNEALADSDWKIINVSKTATGAIPGDVIICAGSDALRQVLNKQGTAPVLATLLTRHNYETILAESGRNRGRVTAIFLDQPPARQANFLRQLLPQQKKIGMLISAETQGLLTSYRNAFKNIGLTLDSETSGGTDGLLPALNALLGRVNVLLAIPDGNIYKRDNIKAILVTTYRYQRPLIAFSAPFVTAGALAALYTTPAQIARQTAELISKVGTTLPPPMPPSQFSIAINQNVAAALGLSIPDEGAVRRAMLAESASP
jgi:putative tryptophan/tyrosine transport system substrate-binding protein